LWLSFLELLENSCEGDLLESLQGLCATCDFHAEDRSFPGGEQEIGKFVWCEGAIDFAAGLGFADARGEQAAPLWGGALAARLAHRFRQR
jgi:hypothetical protein